MFSKNKRGDTWGDESKVFDINAVSRIFFDYDYENFTHKILIQHVFISGLNINAMQQLLPPGTRLARLMTNTPVQFRQGVSSFSLGPNCTAADRNTISNLLEAIGYCTEVKEELVDTVTGFAGGGPAYVYCVIEAIADGAVLGGINRQEAMQMAARTVIGAATMIQETKKHPGQLKDEVCSAGGSTINGVRVLEQGKMRGTMIEAVRASAERSKELGKLLKESLNLEKSD